MPENIQGRFLFKSDTLENWESLEENFQTLKGELYIYNNAYATDKINHAGNPIYKPLLKIGNGNDNLSQINFWNDNYITNEQIENLFNNSSSNILDTAALDSLILE